MPEASPVEATKRPRIRFRSTPTNLYDLVEALVNELDGEDQELVPRIVMQLVHTGKIRFVRRP